MNRNMLYQTLIRAARTEKVENGIPSGFDARVLEAIQKIEPDETLSQLRHSASVLWKAAFSCAGVAAVVCLTAVVFVIQEDGSQEYRPGGARDLGPVTEVFIGAGDEIASVLIEDLEAGDLW
jgi:hypothetical protein